MRGLDIEQQPLKERGRAIPYRVPTKDSDAYLLLSSRGPQELTPLIVAPLLHFILSPPTCLIFQVFGEQKVDLVSLGLGYEILNLLRTSSA